MKTWMRRRGDRVRTTSGNYAGHSGTVESNVYQRTVDWAEEFANGYHVMLDTEVLVTVRWEQPNENRLGADHRSVRPIVRSFTDSAWSR